MDPDDDSVLTSVGIDIGTTTTQLVVSHLHLERPPTGTSVAITDREIVHRGAIRTTPLLDPKTLDTEAIRTYVLSELSSADLSVAAVDTGAVIVTGESAFKQNANELVQSLAEGTGEFVIATAGPSLEAVLAGKGSGAADYARRSGKTVANVDIGGGTTNISVFSGDATVETRCLDVGGRLVRFSERGTVTHISEPAAKLLERGGVNIEEGATPEPDDVATLVNAMVTALFDALSGPPVAPTTEALAIGSAEFDERRIDCVLFSGGVGQLVYGSLTGEEMPDGEFGDLGPVLATALADRMDENSFEVREPEEDINATVIGAGARTTELSGSTISVADSYLPLRDVPVVEVPSLEDVSTAEEMYETVGASIGTGENLYESGRDNFALFLPTIGELRYDRISTVANVLATLYEERYTTDRVLIVVTNQNCAKILGQRIRAASTRSMPLIVVDEIYPTDGDYIDVGTTLYDGETVPVVIKSLVFGERPR
jgi:ethanolamine utilization protein EutA